MRYLVFKVATNEVVAVFMYEIDADRYKQSHKCGEYDYEEIESSDIHEHM